MARVYHKKGVHTSPETAGAHNVPEKLLKKDQDSSASLGNALYKKGNENKKKYKGQWTPETLSAEIQAMFDWCEENDYKPSLPMLKCWLNLARETFNEWRKNRARYGEKSDILNQAIDAIEIMVVDRLEKYPTGNQFLLKSKFGYRDTKTVDITSNGHSIGSTPEEVDAMLKRLGLDKDEE